MFCRIFLVILLFIFNCASEQPETNHKSPIKPSITSQYSIEDNTIETNDDIKSNNQNKGLSRTKAKFNPDDDISYYVYSRKTPNMGQRIFKGDNESIGPSFFSVGKPVKVTIHGWTGDLTSYVNVEVRRAFLKEMDVNIIAVDWSKGSGGLYAEAVQNVPETGRSIGDFLDWLNTIGVPFSNMHVIGHSLGGQLAGFVCRSCKKGRVGYLTGLDPAHPSWGEDSDRISKKDAEYVEIIHTNCDRFGMMDPTGHTDFYPNGGIEMPGCAGKPGCSHARCIDYFAESIDHKKFLGVQCSNVSDALAKNCSSLMMLHMGGAKAKKK